MADYYSPTVIQPDIPAADITALERFILTQVFQFEPHGEGLYFFSEDGPDETPQFIIADLKAALAVSSDIPSRTRDVVADLLSAALSDAAVLDIDLTSDLAWSAIFQDIIHRSATLQRVEAQTAFTCSRMRSDGFGGMAVLITAHQVLARSTYDVMAELHAEADRRNVSVGPSDGVHVLLQLNEHAVRASAQAMIAANASATLAPEAVTDADIRGACLAVAQWSRRTDEREAAVHAAALLAISGAARRVAASD